jgi:hypothetical protein
MTGGEDRTFDFRLGVAVGAHGVNHDGRLHLSWYSEPTREVSPKSCALRDKTQAAERCPAALENRVELSWPSRPSERLRDPCRIRTLRKRDEAAWIRDS